MGEQANGVYQVWFNGPHVGKFWVDDKGAAIDLAKHLLGANNVTAAAVLRPVEGETTRYGCAPGSDAELVWSWGEQSELYYERPHGLTFTPSAGSDLTVWRDGEHVATIFGDSEGKEVDAWGSPIGVVVSAEDRFGAFCKDGEGYDDFGRMWMDHTGEKPELRWFESGSISMVAARAVVVRALNNKEAPPLYPRRSF